MVAQELLKTYVGQVHLIDETRRQTPGHSRNRTQEIMSNKMSWQGRTGFHVENGHRQPIILVPVTQKIWMYGYQIGWNKHCQKFVSVKWGSHGWEGLIIWRRPVIQEVIRFFITYFWIIAYMEISYNEIHLISVHWDTHCCLWHRHTHARAFLCSVNSAWESAGLQMTR